MNSITILEKSNKINEKEFLYFLERNKNEFLTIELNGIIKEIDIKPIVENINKKFIKDSYKKDMSSEILEYIENFDENFKENAIKKLSEKKFTKDIECVIYSICDDLKNLPSINYTIGIILFHIFHNSIKIYGDQYSKELTYENYNNFLIDQIKFHFKNQ